MTLLNNRIIKYFGFIILFLFIFTSIISVVFAAADCQPNKDNNYCNYGLGKDKGGTEYVPQPLSANPDIPTTAGKVIGAALSFVGVLFFVLMIYGGILWMTASGNDQQVGKAKDLITAAVIGIIIVLSAYAITAFIGGELTS